MPEKITFFESYYEAASCLDKDERLNFYDAIFEYAFSGIEPEFTGGMAVAWKLVKPNIDKSIERSESGRKGAEKTNNTTRQTADTDSRNGCSEEPQQLDEVAGTAVENSLPRKRSRDKEKDRDKEDGQGKGEGVGTVLVQDQNQNRSVQRVENGKPSGGDAALPKGAASTAEQDGKNSDIAVVRAQLVAVQAELDHDPSNAYFAREVQRLKARLHRLETKGERR